MKLGAAATVALPSFGPAVVMAWGTQVPVLALALSIVALLLARWIAPPPLRKLSRGQQVALTGLLLIFLALAVTGELPIVGEGRPMGAGMAVVVGAGLGFSGLMAVELMGERIVAALKAMLGSVDK